MPRSRKAGTLRGEWVAACAVGALTQKRVLGLYAWLPRSGPRGLSFVSAGSTEGGTPPPGWPPGHRPVPGPKSRRSRPSATKCAHRVRTRPKRAGSPSQSRTGVAGMQSCRAMLYPTRPPWPGGQPDGVPTRSDQPQTGSLPHGGPQSPGGRWPAVLSWPLHPHPSTSGATKSPARDAEGRRGPSRRAHVRTAVAAGVPEGSPRTSRQVGRSTLRQKLNTARTRRIMPVKNPPMCPLPGSPR